jgi:hypothetical protein
VACCRPPVVLQSAAGKHLSHDPRALRQVRLTRPARAGVALVIASLCGAAVPQGRPTATILARDSDTCAAWVQEATPAHRQWVFGYLSGLNAAWGGNHRSPADVLAKVEGEGPVTEWMDNYCRRHPLHSLQQAAHQYYRELSSR